MKKSNFFYLLKIVYKIVHKELLTFLGEGGGELIGRIKERSDYSSCITIQHNISKEVTSFGPKPSESIHTSLLSLKTVLSP